MKERVRLQFQLESSAGPSTLEVPIGCLVIAGWTGRDRAAMEAHIAELEELGVARPPKTPMFYRVGATRMTQSDDIEVPGTGSSGEVEFVLIRCAGRTYVGVGSDHTDREVETYGVTVSKQMCDKPVSSAVWPFDEVAPHWDRLLLRSWAQDGETETLYQEGPVTAMLDPADLLARYEAEDGPFTDGTVMFCGTLAAKGGVRYAERFRIELEDPVMGRSISHAYSVTPIPLRG